MNVLVTGAAAGLAQGIAVALARDGHDIALTGRAGGTPADRTLELIRGCGGDAAAFEIDVLESEGVVAAAWERIVSARGPFDVVVHAIGPMTIARFERSTMETYRAMIDGNLRSAVQVAMAVLPAMRERKFGRLVFFGMNGSQVTMPARGLSLHVAAKSGLVAFARTLALEEGRYGVTINTIEIGDIREKAMTREQARGRVAANPRGRPGSWEDVAGAVRFLIDAENDFVNGAVLSVAGGLSEPFERNG